MRVRHHISARTSRRERGSVVVTIAFCLAVCFACAVMVTDFGLIWLSRAQLQNAADAAALAGAYRLVKGSKDDAYAAAVQVAGQNRAWQDGMQSVVIGGDDITFPTARRCRVTTHRTEATGDPLRTFFVSVIDPDGDLFANVTATAEAEYYYVCESPGLKPWSIPDRWNDLDADDEYDYEEEYEDDNGNGQWDPGEDYEDDNHNGQWDPAEPYDPTITGYLAPQDVGTQVALKIGDPSDTITHGFFFAVDFPPLGGDQGSPIPGGNQYKWNIINESPYTIAVGDLLQVEPGNMVGPTKHGVKTVIDADPGAYWDNATNTVKGSAYGTSPRVVKIALFDPESTPPPGRRHVVVSKLGAFFLEGIDRKGTLHGRFMDLSTIGEPCGPEPSLLTSVRLSQ